MNWLVCQVFWGDTAYQLLFLENMLTITLHHIVSHARLWLGGECDIVITPKVVHQTLSTHPCSNRQV
jgi:hypothetical protein